MTRTGRWLAVAMAVAIGAACGGKTSDPPAGASGVASSTNEPAPPAKPKPVTLTGSAVAMAADDRNVIVADEDHEALFVVPTSFEADGVRVVQVPGPPAQVVDAGDAIFVTIRTLTTGDARSARDAIKGPPPTREAMKVSGKIVDPPPPASASAAPVAPPPSSAAPSASIGAAAAPTALPKLSADAKKQRGTRPLMFDPAVVRKSEGGLLLVMKRDDAKGLVEVGRVVLPPDAWGVSLTPDTKRAVVSSAWSSQISVVDVGERTKPTVVRSLSSAREPRGIAIKSDGSAAYVSHLVGSTLTRIDGIAGAEPTMTRVDLPAARSRAPRSATVSAALGYALVLSPDDRTLYAPRHALGADGVAAWWGTTVVDTMDVKSEKPLQPERSKTPRYATPSEDQFDPRMPLADPPEWGSVIDVPPPFESGMVQPRAAVFRASKGTLLVASEGMDEIVELDARLPDPAMSVIRRWTVGGDYAQWGEFAERGGAPTGLALSRDDASVYVFCRSTFDLVRIDVDRKGMRTLHLADDGLPLDAAYGRRLWYNARSTTLSGGLACAACHPEGRDDGYVWREMQVGTGEWATRRFVASRALLKLNGGFAGKAGDAATIALAARQTPMLAGRMRANGPYAWHGEDKDILDRLESGFALHRASWEQQPDVKGVGQHVAKVDYIADFLRSGLLPPPTIARDLTDVEKRGREVFLREAVACASCHKPESELTDRSLHKLGIPPSSKEIADETELGFKTPSLMFVSGTAPFFHDGSAATLTELVERNGKRMGDTSSLDADERKALVAYLETL